MAWGMMPAAKNNRPISGRRMYAGPRKPSGSRSGTPRRFDAMTAVSPTATDKITAKV
jgi:hypothetical protein